jgi:two-component system, OmpR family, response regulator
VDRGQPLEQPPPDALRIVIVDDNRDAADSLAFLLELYDYAVEVAYDGPTGLRVTQEFVPDCLISDISMPGLDGYGLAQRVRADPALGGVKLVALSAYSDDEHTRKATEAGFDYQVTKANDPLEIIEVLRMIEEIKALATTTQELAKKNVELAGQTKELLHEVKEEVKEVKQEVKELKKEVKELKEERNEKTTEGKTGSG